ncbi:MAG: hypothetical protein HOV80_11745, partial [Polyangiaceae bacterium]|nr:hypothetical protein [Polyangiaceae bacterium]
MQNQRSFFWVSLALAAVPALGCAPGTELPEGEAAEENGLALENALLPDIVVRESDLHTNYLDVTSVPGRRLLRLSNGTANIGLGKLYLYGVTPANADGTQTVMQRVFNAAGEFEDRTAGSFTYHPGHSHVHFDGWASYRIRQILPGDGVGDILAQGEKTSFCILDLGIYSSALPNFDPDGEFHSCGSTIQGLAVGWVDVYGAGLSGQSIDVTDVAEGTYWLESVVDPTDKVLESDETNNATRIKVTIGAPPLAEDAYEPNNDAAATNFHPVGQMNSSNLGPVNPSRTITGLSLHDAADVDWFRFYANDTGGASDFVRVNHVASQGDIDLELRDAAGNLVASSAQTGVDVESISLEGRTEGWYYAVVRAKPGAANPSYSLTIDPPANQAPSIAITAPGPGNVDVAHAIDTYNATWTASDPEGDATWVTLWLNEQPSLDGTQILLETSRMTPGEEGFHIVNTSYAPEGTYWVYAEVTDGGTTVGTWSPGTVSFVPNPVCAHPVCQQGAKLNAPVCDTCTQQICAVDPYCCNTAWDSICVGEVASVCQLACAAGIAADVSVAARGSRVVLTGTGFGGATSVTIGGVEQTFVADSATSITIPAVADATPTGSQGIAVTTSTGAATGPSLTVIDLVVNELDSDTTGTDVLEFVEISTGVPGVSLNGYSLVLFNGGNDRSYLVVSLDGVVSGPNGLAVIGNPGVVPAPQKTFANNLLQNGADAVAIYQGTYASNAAIT